MKFFLKKKNKGVDKHKKSRYNEYRCGGIAQLARAHGSYPWCREFESPFRYYYSNALEEGTMYIVPSFVLSR